MLPPGSSRVLRSLDCAAGYDGTVLRPRHPVVSSPASPSQPAPKPNPSPSPRPDHKTQTRPTLPPIVSLLFRWTAQHGLTVASGPGRSEFCQTYTILYSILQSTGNLSCLRSALPPTSQPALRCSRLRCCSASASSSVPAAMPAAGRKGEKGLPPRPSVLLHLLNPQHLKQHLWHLWIWTWTLMWILTWTWIWWAACGAAPRHLRWTVAPQP